MKRFFIILMALSVVFFFVSATMAGGKSVVSIVGCKDKAELKLLAEDFHFNDDVSHEQTNEYHERTGDYPHVVWSEVRCPGGGADTGGRSRGAIEKTPHESADRAAIARLASSARGTLRLRPAAGSP